MNFPNIPTNGNGTDDFRHTLGHLGEQLAANYLRDEGYGILEHRYRTAAGEVDLIVVKGKMLVFVEVKTRTSSKFGDSIESVNSLKLHRLSKVAHSYCHRYNWRGDWRIDVIGVEFSSLSDPARIEHLQDVTL